LLQMQSQIKKIQATRELWLHFGRLLSEQGSL
jgi:hypothetical protein